MDLCNSETLAGLMAQPQARHKGVARMTRKGVGLSAVYVPPAHKARNRGCKCGQCSQCREYARWDRIFREKFADPNYYTQIRYRYSSPLCEL
jgi:hypothetical protein